MMGSVYHKISKYVDERLLKPILHKFNDFAIKDSFTFQKKIVEIDLEDHEKIISLDVKSLFTNIPVRETIDIICDELYHSDRPPPKLHDEPLSEHNCRLLLSSLISNVKFSFNNTTFEQTHGLAMGSPLSGSFSEIFMGKMEKDMASKLKSLKLYGRYVDDTIIIVPDEEIDDIFNLFNAQHPAISFTMEHANHFLDVNIHRDTNGKITTSIHRKDTL